MSTPHSILSLFVHAGHYVLVNELLGQLREAEAGRVVIITSAAYGLGQINYDDINQDKVTTNCCIISQRAQHVSVELML